MMPTKKPFMTDMLIELHVPDFKKTIAFYTLLGFHILRIEDSPKGYLVMKRGKSILNFYGGHRSVSEHAFFKKFPSDTKRGYGVEIILPVQHIKNFYNTIKNRVPVVKPLELKRWGAWDFRIVDPFGYYICCTGPRNSKRGTP
jgi:lactoylglutathione lyase